MAKTEAEGRRKQKSAPRSKMLRPFLRMTELIEADDTKVEGLVLIELQKGGYALMEETAHDLVAELVGRDPVYYYNKGGQVQVTPPKGYGKGGKAVPAAKLLVERREGRSWKYPHFKDGNRFNLRDSNIYGSDEPQDLSKRWPGGVDPNAPTAD